ncbi:MAG: hypothetical protein K2N34_04160 [Lachnospiraceae bacterium]|nr:hypothetical protein [Lachnospiraceae bacterium]
MAEPSVRPVGDHVNITGYIFMGYAVKHIADGGSCFDYGHSCLTSDFFALEIVGDVTDVFGRGIVSY